MPSNAPLWLLQESRDLQVSVLKHMMSELLSLFIHHSLYIQYKGIRAAVVVAVIFNPYSSVIDRGQASVSSAKSESLCLGKTVSLRNYVCAALSVTAYRSTWPILQSPLLFSRWITHTHTHTHTTNLVLCIIQLKIRLWSSDCALRRIWQHPPWWVIDEHTNWIKLQRLCN